MHGMRPNLLLKGKGSPVVNPIVIRPGTALGQNIFNSPKTPTHASASNASVITSKLPGNGKEETPVSQPAFQRGDNFNADKIN